MIAPLVAMCGCGKSQPAPEPVVVPPVVSDGVRRYALLVGVSEYDDPTFSNLAYPELDVTGLAASLATGGYNQGDVTVMTVSAGRADAKLKPTAANIQAKLTEVLARCGPNDLLLVGFTGHGVELAPGQPYFCPSGCRLTDPATLVNLAAVQKQLAESGAGTKVLLSDACRVAGSKAPVGQRPVAPADIPTVTAKATTTMITYFSCSAGEYSWESEKLQHGLFFAYLIDGLAGSADANGDGKVMWSELVSYVEGKVSVYNADNPGRKQTPHSNSDARNAAALTNRAPPTTAVAAVAGTGTLILRTSKKIRDDVEAWVEIDGKRVATWPVGTTEVLIVVQAGQHRVAVYSVFQKQKSTVYDQMGLVTQDQITTIQVGK